MANELKQARKIRSTLLGLLTREKNKILDDEGQPREDIDDMDHNVFVVMLSLVEDYYGRFVQADEKVMLLEDIPEGADVDNFQVSETSARFYSDYALVKSTLLSLLAASKPKSEDSGNASTTVIQSKAVRLPKLEIPKFSGKFSEWLDFKNEFESMIIQDKDLKDVDRFRYLKSSLMDGAKRIISNMEVSDENFKKAWQALKDRYDNTALIFRSHINEIVNLKSVSGTGPERYRDLLDIVQAHMRSLSSLGSETNVAENLIICLVLSRLDSKAQAKWEETSTNEIATWEQFSSFLEKYASTLEKVDQTRQQQPQATSTPKKNFPRKALSFAAPSRTASTRAASKAVPNRATSSTCIKCNSNGHTILECGLFLSKTPTSRYLEAKGLKACVRCLDTHSTRNCHATCKKCKGNHHELLHFEDQPSTSSSGSGHENDVQISGQPISKSTNPASINRTLMASNHLIRDQALLASAVVVVQDDSGTLFPCHTLLDSGSTDNYISDRFVRLIKAKRVKHRGPQEVGGIGGTSTRIDDFVVVKFKSKEGSHEYELAANILPKITEVYPSSKFDISHWNIPSKLNLADPHFNVPKRFDLLIGAGLFWSLLIPEKIPLGPGLPYIQNTELGWIVVGSAPPDTLTRPSRNNLCFSANQADESLNELVQKFWELDVIPETKPLMNSKDIECETHFVANTVRDSSGRYVVRLPFTDDPSKLGNSLDIALKRFQNLEHRLEKHPDLKKQYVEFIREYEALGHLEKVDDFNPFSQHYFIPHHCVLKPTSSTTKLRVVFDASCKTSSGISLNDILHTGPRVQDDLFTLLLRFRLYKYVATSDVQKMYRQIRIHHPDCNFQLILWREDPSESLKVLKLLTVTYGTGPGAFLAIRALTQLADDEESKYPIGAQLLRNNFYVDDAMIGGDTVPELQEKLNQLKGILELGGFKLGKYCSNSNEILSEIPPELQEKYLKIDDHDIIKALGMMWQPDLDVFRYTHELTPNDDVITKRIVLSKIAKIFDPLGFICPVVTMAKIFYQALWKLKLDWDQPLSSELVKKWKLFDGQLNNLRNVTIPRFVLEDANCKSIEVHGFSDASEKAYGACVYIRTVHANDSVSVRLLCAKSRIAPTKTISIARLELCAAKLLVDLMNKLRTEVLNQIQIAHTYYWTDSEIVLHWVSAEPHNWSTFVAHRVTKIQEIAPGHAWKHIPGHLNPADIISRGMLPDEIAASSIWWHGPEFLLETSLSWPSNGVTLKPTAEIEEARKVKASFIAIKYEDLTSSMRFSVNFRGIRRAFAYVLRFIARCRKPVLQKDARILKMQAINYESIKGPTIEEEIKAEELFIKSIQASSFKKEYNALSNEQTITRQSALIKLTPFIDCDGVMRVGGRLKRSQLPYDSKHQILLPRNHPFTLSVIRYFHEKRVFHAGPQTTLAAVRSRYWPVGGLQLTRRVIYNCIWCFRINPRFADQLMGQLPNARVQTYEYRPFVVSGVDFAGPITVRHHVRCKQNKEVHLALFICFLTKAVHIELVTDLSTEAFLRALRRFIADRGKVAKIYSDNARNFIGACNYLKEVKAMLINSRDEIEQECNQQHIEWSFIPPRTPHHGGLWEASIKLMKKSIKNIVGTLNLTEDELRTVAKHAGSILNSRPISTLSADPNDLEPLSPGHFLYGGPPTALPEINFDLSIAENANKVHIYQRMQYAIKQLWNRFHHEYLNLLQPRTKWLFENKEFQVGRLILLKEQHIEPLKWKLGRIIGVVPDADGIVRILRVKTAKGEYDRAVNSVALLPSDVHCLPSQARSQRRGGCSQLT